MIIGKYISNQLMVMLVMASRLLIQEIEQRKFIRKIYSSMIPSALVYG